MACRGTAFTFTSLQDIEAQNISNESILVQNDLARRSEELGSII
jgi:hypothetical protein